MADFAGIVLALTALALVALLPASRRLRSTPDDVDAPLQRLSGFHIFGPDEDDPPLHVPVLRTRVDPVPAAPEAPPVDDAPEGADVALALRRVTVFATREPFATALPEAPPPPAQAPAPSPALDPVPEMPVAATAQPRPARPAERLDRAAVELPLDGDILLVEDDVAIAELYRLLLHSRGYATRHAHDGAEGIAMVREERPALILLDMMMPRMDGLQFLEALRTWPKTSAVPVVVLSNADNLHLVDRAMELGAVEYLVKAQTRPQVLVGALPHWLRGNRALSALA